MIYASCFPRIDSDLRADAVARKRQCGAGKAAEPAAANLKSLILLADTHHDLADMAAAFHQLMAFRDLIEVDHVMDDRCHLAGFQ